MRTTPAVLEGLEHQGAGIGTIQFGQNGVQFSNAFSTAFRNALTAGFGTTNYAVSGSSAMVFGGTGAGIRGANGGSCPRTWCS